MHPGREDSARWRIVLLQTWVAGVHPSTASVNRPVG